MPNFPPGFAAFAIAGVLAAAGPVIIHLLNRRRFRVLDWAAMDFLLEALQRNRKILQLRDIIVLVLRTLCVLLFGFALARPFFTSGSGAGWQVFFVTLIGALLFGLLAAALWTTKAARFSTLGIAGVLLLIALATLGRTVGRSDEEGPTLADSGQAVHAVLLMDNSLSMGYQRELTGTLLDEARAKAIEFVNQLPEGSRITVVPLCGSSAGYSLDAYRSKDDAKEALERIEVVDRSVNGKEAAALALEACAASPELSKRIVLLGDQQRSNWDATAADQWKQLPELQVVEISADQPQNTWISEFEVQDAIADVETETKFTAVVRNEGAEPRPGVQATLTVDGAVVGTKTVDLEPGQSMPISFDYRFDVQVEPGRPAFVPAEISLSPDRLPQDDVRHLVVPVLAAVPVVFIDELGDDEDRDKNQYGETWGLRRLLAPVTSKSDTGRQLIQVRHKRVDEVDRTLLEDARLVVMAGVPNPGPIVELLREYVEQGGQLVIAAGGEFDIDDWNKAAWLDGEGILPLPLATEPIGQVPENSDERLSPLKPFRLSFASMAHDYFILPDEPNESLEALYQLPVFFKAVKAESQNEIRESLLKAETERLESKIKFLALSDENRVRWTKLEEAGKLEGADREARDDDASERDRIEPHWLKWDHARVPNPLAERPEPDQVETFAAKLAERCQPRVLAKYDNGAPFIVERNVGRGRIVLATTGVATTQLGRSWNNLAESDPVIIYDRIFRSMLESTLPERNYGSSRPITLAVRGAERRGRFVLAKPSGGPLVTNASLGAATPSAASKAEDLYVEALGADSFGVTIRDVTQRGAYRVTAYPADGTATGVDGADAGIDAKLWEVPLAVNGPNSESEFALIDEEGLKERMAGANYRWVNSGSDISLQGAQVTGQDLWWWLILLVLVSLVVEMVILAWPKLAEERSA